jgi:hypothetical protein
MSTMSAPTTGVPNATKPGRWIVPPWPVHARLYDVVNHFVRFAPSDNASATEKLAYYKGYLAAMDAASRNELKDHDNERWYADFRDSISRCVTLYQDKHTAENQRARKLSTALPKLSQAAPR